VKGSGDNVAVRGQADVEIRGELLYLGGNRGLVAAAAPRLGGQPLDVGPQAGEADKTGRTGEADVRIGHDFAVGVDADGSKKRIPNGYLLHRGIPVHADVHPLRGLHGAVDG
jgi:hypothetical protein